MKKSERQEQIIEEYRLGTSFKDMQEILGLKRNTLRKYVDEIEVELAEYLGIDNPLPRGNVIKLYLGQRVPDAVIDGTWHVRWCDRPGGKLGGVTMKRHGWKFLGNPDIMLADIDCPLCFPHKSWLSASEWIFFTDPEDITSAKRPMHPLGDNEWYLSNYRERVELVREARIAGSQK